MPGGKPEGAEFDVIFRPIQTEQNKLMEFYRCVPVYRMPDDTFADAPQALRKGERAEDFWVKNEIVVKEGMDGLKVAVKQGLNTKLLVPVHAEVAAKKATARELLALFKTYDERLRKRVMVDVVGLEADVSMDMMEDVTIPLMAVTDKMVAQAPRGMDDFKIFSNLNYLGMSLDLLDKDWGGEELGELLDSFALNSRHWRLRPFVTGVKTPDILNAVRDIGPYAIDGMGLNPGSKQVPMEWPQFEQIQSEMTFGE